MHENSAASKARIMAAFAMAAALGLAGGLSMWSPAFAPALAAALALLGGLATLHRRTIVFRAALSTVLLLAMFASASAPIGMAFAVNFASHSSWQYLCDAALAVWTTAWYMPAVIVTLYVARRMPFWLTPLVLGALIAASEYLRVEHSPNTLALLAYGFTDTPLLRTADMLGPFGAGALAVSFCGWIAAVVLHRDRMSAGLIALVFVLWAMIALAFDAPASAPALTTTSTTRVTVATANPADARQPVKWLVESVEHELSAAEGDLLVFSETTLPVPWQMLPASARDQLVGLAAKRNVALAIGGYRQLDERAYNTAVFLSPQDSEPRFVDKHVLFPLMEYMPHGTAWLRDALRLPGRDLSAGPADASTVTASGRAVGIVICYDVALPSLFARRATNADWMLLLSDMSWFGGTAASAHLQAMARWRAAENKRWLLSVAAPNEALLINPQGTVVARNAELHKPWRLSIPPAEGTGNNVRARR
jgi:apolipoprotein N-acyltransferase